MMIQRIGALTSSNTNAPKIKQQQYQTAPSFEGLGVNKSAKTMKALAAAAILGMASVGMSSCSQPTDPTPIEVPEKPPVDETSEVEPVAPINNPASINKVKDTTNYKILEALGFNVEVVDVDSDYWKKMLEDDNECPARTGDLIGMKFNNVEIDKYYNPDNKPAFASEYKGKIICNGSLNKGQINIGLSSFPEASWDHIGSEGIDLRVQMNSYKLFGNNKMWNWIYLNEGSLSPVSEMYLNGTFVWDSYDELFVDSEEKIKISPNQLTFQLANVKDDNGLSRNYAADDTITPSVNENSKYSSIPESVKSSNMFKLIGSWGADVEVIDISKMFENPEDMEGLESGDMIGAKINNIPVEPEDILKMRIWVGNHYRLTLENYINSINNGYIDFYNKKIEGVTFDSSTIRKRYNFDGKIPLDNKSDTDVVFQFAYVPENK